MNIKYTIKVGNEQIKVTTDEGIDIAIEKAVEIWNKRKGFYSKFRPNVIVLESEIIK
jgi:hypothetical protein